MKLEHKIGIAITCTFLCLTGAVIGLKMQQEQPAPTMTEQVASNSKDIETPKGKQTNLSVPTVLGDQPPAAPTSPAAKQQGPKGGEPTSGGSAGTTIGDKSKQGEPLDGGMFRFGAGDLPRFNAQPAPAQPAPVAPATDPSRKKAPPLDVQGFGVSNSESATNPITRSRAAERASQTVAPEPEKKQASSEGPMMVGFGEQSTSSSTASSSGDRANQKAGGSVTGDSQAPASGRGKKDAASAEKEKKQDQTTLNNQLEQESLPNNGSPASFLTGGSPTGGTSKPTTPPPATPPTRNIIPIGAFDGSQTAPSSSSGAPTLETDKDKAPIPPSSSTTGGAGSSTATPPSWSMDSDKAPGNKGGTSGQGNPLPTPPIKSSDPRAGDGKPAPSLIPGGEKGNEDKFTGSPPPPLPSPMMDKLPDNKTAPAPAPPAPSSPPAPANKPANDSYFIPDPHSTTGSDANNAAGAGGRSTAAPPGKLPYPEMPASPLIPSSPSGTERVKPSATGGTTTAPQAVARPQPQVVVYDEQEYRAAAGDTFETISKKYYGTEKFAEALRRHNRYHARASLQMANEGTLAPGERLYIPPADILEQRYGDTIVKPPSSQAVPASFTSPSGASGK
jgi:hypothetical protein